MNKLERFPLLNYFSVVPNTLAHLLIIDIKSFIKFGLNELARMFYPVKPFQCCSKHSSFLQIMDLKSFITFGLNE
jgi:hypothetical protein